MSDKLQFVVLFSARALITFHGGSVPTSMVSPSKIDKLKFVGHEE